MKKKYNGDSIKKGNGKALTIVLLSATAFVLVVAVVLLTYFTVFGAEAKPVVEVTVNTNSSDTDDISDEAPEIITVQKSLVEEMKAIEVKPGEDIYSSKEDTEALLRSDTADLLDNILRYDMNTCILDLSLEDSVIFRNSELKNSSVDLLKIFCELAKEKNVKLYVSLSFNSPAKYNKDKIESLAPAEVTELFCEAVSQLAEDYEIDGVILKDFNATKSAVAYKSYIKSGSRLTYTQWLCEVSYKTASAAKDAILAVKEAMPVGIAVSEVWANEDDDPDGSATDADYRDYINGNADTRKMAFEGGFDFVLVDMESSLQNAKTPFNTIVKWWNSVCKEAEIPMYILHHNEYLGDSSKQGFEGTDQIARQVSAALKQSEYQGSVFNSLSALNENIGNSTDILIKYYAEEYADEELNRDLAISLPEKRSTSTYGTTVHFMGTFDKNQTVTLDGEPIATLKGGEFDIIKTLKVGVNKFTFEHKGKQTVYTVEKKVDVLKSVSPTASQKVAGKTVITFSAVAYKGSSVSVSINGTTVKMAEGGTESEEVENTSYAMYTGTYTCPAAATSDKNLGTPVFSASYAGYSEKMSGGRITVEKKEEVALLPSGTAQMATVNVRYADVVGYKTMPAEPDAIHSQLPRGTMDVVTGTSGEFVNLQSGKTVYKDEVTIAKSSYYNTNTINSLSVGIGDNKTTLSIAMNWKSPFSITPSNYPTSQGGIADTFKFNSTTITLTLDYVDSVSDLVGSLTQSSVFSKITTKIVTINGIKRCQLTITLKKSGKYYGCYTSWSGNTLVVKFNQAPTGDDLSGMTICIDPGHGGKDAGAVGYDNYEKNLNLAVALKLRTELEKRGAKVVMTRTSDTICILSSSSTTYRNELNNRVEVGQAAEADLFISVHHNASTSSSAQGVQTHFNVPFSQPLAAAIQSQLGSISGGLKNRGVLGPHTYSYNFRVTRDKQCPSVLIELGFISNASDVAKISSSSYQTKEAAAIAKGIVAFYK